MFVKGKLFGGDEAHVERRYIRDYRTLGKLVEHLKGLGAKIVLTSGTFDILHVGHQRYLAAAKTHGDILIVGVDSDEKVRDRKGPTRPIVSEDERIEMLAHQRSVDIITLKPLNRKKWELIRLIRPDVLVATRETYTPSERKQLRRLCGKIVVLQPQAPTSTTARIRRLHIDGQKALVEKLMGVLQEHLSGGEGE